MIDPKERKKEEDKYFKKQDAEKLKKMQAEKGKKAEKERLQKLRDLHWMHCPKCGHELTERLLEEVKIDVCSNCEGIWLDKGELETLRGKEGFLFQHIINLFK